MSPGSTPPTRNRASHAASYAGLCAALLCCALLLPAISVEAQSGRHRTQPPTTSQPSQQRTPSGTSTRSRTVNTTTTTGGASPERTGATTSGQRSSQPAPDSPIDVGEAPPVPVVKATPAPAKPAPVQGDDEIDASDVVRISSNLVTVPASVIDAQGKVVTNLKLEDFELRVDGQPRPISDLGFADSPVRMAVLFDNSSSLIAAREFERQAAVRFFRSVLRPTDQAMIYSVSTVPALEQPLTNDIQTLVRTIERFPKPEGATALFDAISQAAAYLKPHQEGRRVIIIVSDGADTISDLDFETTLRRVQAADCQIYAVQTGHMENANLRDLAAERRLQEFTAQTGGAVYVPRGTSDLDAAFAQISADLSQQYILSYYPEDEQKDGRFRTISVRVTTRPGLRVRARKGYYALPGQKQAWLPNVTPAPSQPSTLLAQGGPGSGSGPIPNQVQLSAAGPAVDASADRSAAANPTAPSLYLKTNTQSSVRDRVGPKGPSDDSIDVDEGKKREPEIIPSTGSPPAPSTSQSSTQPASQPASQTFSPAPSPASSSAPSIASSPTSSSTSSNASSSTSSSAPAPGASTALRPAPTPAAPTPPATSPSASPSPAAKAPAKAAAGQAQTDAKSAQKGPVNQGVLNGKAVSLPKPFYPSTARSIGAVGTVVIEVTVDENGKVIAARALSGHPLLQGPCLTAARLAKFSPTVLSGQPVKVTGTITYTFAQK